MGNKEKLRPVHPGEVLLEEFLKPMGLSQSRVALAIGVHPRLAKFFGTSPDLWLGLQKDCELDVAKDEVGDQIERDVRTLASVGQG